MDFQKVLGLVAEFLAQQRVRFGVIGAFGLQAYGVTRATEDLDFVLEAKAQPALLAYLASLGYELLHASPSYSNHQHALAALGRVDFVYVDAGTANQLFEGAKDVPTVPGGSVKVPRPEFLAAMKVLAMKNDPARTFQDMADIQSLMALPGVDCVEIRSYFEQHGLLERYLEIEKALEASHRDER